MVSDISCYLFICCPLNNICATVRTHGLHGWYFSSRGNELSTVNHTNFKMDFKVHGSESDTNRYFYLCPTIFNFYFLLNFVTIRMVQCRNDETDNIIYCVYNDWNVAFETLSSLLLVFSYVLILFLYVIPLLRVVSCYFKNSYYLPCLFQGFKIQSAAAIVVAISRLLWLHHDCNWGCINHIYPQYQGPQENHNCNRNLKPWFILYRSCVCVISMLPS